MNSKRITTTLLLIASLTGISESAEYLDSVTQTIVSWLAMKTVQ